MTIQLSIKPPFGKPSFSVAESRAWSAERVDETWTFCRLLESQKTAVSLGNGRVAGSFPSRAAPDRAELRGFAFSGESHRATAARKAGDGAFARFDSVELSASSVRGWKWRI
jgi:hypothetical protein